MLRGVNPGPHVRFPPIPDIPRVSAFDPLRTLGFARHKNAQMDGVLIALAAIALVAAAALWWLPATARWAAFATLSFLLVAGVTWVLGQINAYPWRPDAHLFARDWPVALIMVLFVYIPCAFGAWCLVKARRLMRELERPLSTQSGHQGERRNRSPTGRDL